VSIIKKDQLILFRMKIIFTGKFMPNTYINNVGKMQNLLKLL